MPQGQYSKDFFNSEEFYSKLNYANAFFENDEGLEEYYKQLKEALIVHSQKEMNISHEMIKN